jgi:glutamate-ammonia-ligase adenylyltransferase
MNLNSFANVGLAEANLAELAPISAGLVARLSQTASPDSALTSLTAIARGFNGGAPALLAALERDALLCERLVIVLGTSEALGEFFARHPEHVADLSTANLAQTPPNEAALREWMCRATDVDSLRVQYHRALAALATRDLSALTSFQQSSAELADLAVATLDGALQIARAADADADKCRLTIMALGKTGGHEMNYVSDVDVIFVCEPAADVEEHEALRVGNRLATSVMRLCRDHTPEGTIWEVDPNLRPEGKNGPLVRTVASHVAYYEKWASTWEFQALLKARFGAGDRMLAQQYVERLEPMVWLSSTRPNFVSDMRMMRKRVVENIPAAHRDRQLKLGSGGLRDVEFAVQMLQLVHGRADAALRSPTTLVALDALTEGGYIGRRDGSALEEAYEFLRTLEHRIQIYRLRRTHVVPDSLEDLRRIGRSMGMGTNPAESLVKEWQAHRRLVSRLHEKLFYRPLLDAVASMPTDGLRLTPQAAEQRLQALGFVDPARAMKHISALTAGVSRRAAIQQSLLPLMLEWFAESPDPDAGLLAFRKISDELGDSHWYLRKLRDEGRGAEDLARLVSSSSYVSDLMIRAPDIVAMLGDDAELVPHDLDRLATEMEFAAKRHAIPGGAVRAIRKIRRRELARIAMADVLHRLDVIEVGDALTAINTATLQATLSACEQAWAIDHDGQLPTRSAIVLMGRTGGFETGYGSDADVMFVHDPVDGADPTQAGACAMWIAQLLTRVLAATGDDPPLEVDAELRPEGKNGPLVRSFAAYRSYYQRWSEPWEAQALLRANPVVGDPELCAKFRDLIDPLRYPDGGLSEKDRREIRRIKARVEAERLPRGANPKTHLKLGRGGLADVEWTVQLLQLDHGHAVEGLRTTRTVAALEAAAEADVISGDDAAGLIEAWRLVSQIRNRVVLLRARSADSMVEDRRDRAGLAHLLGEPNPEEMVDHYLRVTRHARTIVENIFFG